MTIEDALEEMAREAELKKLEEEKKGIVSPINSNIVVSEGVDLDKLVVEASALRSQAGKDKDLLSYDASLAGLKSRGYNRHLRPDEVFKIMIDALENPASKWKDVDADLRSSYGEWLSAYFQVSPDGKELAVFLDPENVKWNGSVYVIEGNNGLVKGSSMHKFSLEKIVGKGILGRAKNKKVALQTWVPLGQVNKVNPELVEFLYSRPYDKLPDKIKNNVHLWLPEKGKGWPVGRGNDINYFNLDAFYVNWASRGVRS